MAEKRNAICLIFVFFIVFFIAFISASSITVVPSATSLNPGQTLTVNISATTSPTNLHSIQYDFSYNPSVLSLVSISEGPFLKTGGVVTIFDNGTQGSGVRTGILDVRNTTYSNPLPLTGTGNITTLTFYVAGSGTSPLTVSNVIWVNTSIFNDSASLVTPTITNSNVNSFVLGECDLTNAYWSTSSAVQGDSVQMIVAGVGDCGSKQINFTVWEYDPTFLNPDDYITSMVATYDRGTWTAVYSNEGGIDPDPEFYFDAFEVGDSSDSVRSADPKLDVSPAANTIYVSPAYDEIFTGENHVVEIKGTAPEGSSDIYAIQFDISFNPSVLSVNSINEGSFLNEGGAVETIFNYSAISSGKIDNVYIVRNLTNGNPNAGLHDDEGIFATINFNAIGYGSSGINISDVIWVNSTITNNEAQTINPAITNGSVLVDSATNLPPQITNIQCRYGGLNHPCSDVVYNTQIQNITATCIDNDGTVASARFVLRNLEDNSELINQSGVKAGNVWFYDPAVDYIVRDSGNMQLIITCIDNDAAVNSTTIAWSIPWGTLTPTLVWPQTNVDVIKYQFFWFNSTLTCSGGECGNVTATLDPEVTITGTADTKDNTINYVFKTRQQGGYDYIEVYNEENPGHRSLIKFNLSSIPQSSVITQCNLNLLPFECSQQNCGLNVGVYRLLKDWNEDTSTFLEYSAGNLWQVEGAEGATDKAPIHSNHIIPGIGVWQTFDLTDAGGSENLCQKWISGEYPNYGVLLKIENTSGYNVLKFSSSENTNIANRPYLYVSYSDGTPVKTGAVPMNTGLPFYTTSQNPNTASCQNLKAVSNPTCNTNWYVNASYHNGTYPFFVIYNAVYPGVTDVNSATVNINITGSAVDNPPSVNLISPAANFVSTSNTVVFNASISDDVGIKNVSLYLNAVLNETNVSGLNNRNYAFTKVLADGDYYWTIKACDIADKCTESELRLLTVQVYSDYDVNMDNLVNIADIQMAGSPSWFGRTDCGVLNDWCGRRDVNRNNNLSIQDLSLIGMHFT